MPHSLSLEIAWSAGFFDGEGSTCCVGTPRGTKRTLRISVPQINRSNLERLRRALGGKGNISHQPRISQFSASNEVALSCLRSLWPYIGEEKRNQALRAMVQFAFRGVSNAQLGKMDRCLHGHDLSVRGRYKMANGAIGGCVECKRDLYYGRRDAAGARPTAIEVGIGIRQYEPATFQVSA